MKKRVLSLVLATCLSATLLISCSSSSNKLEGTTWKITGGTSAGQTVTEDQITSLIGDITYEFKEDGVVSANMSGETEEATYEVDGDKVTIKDDSTEVEGTIDGDKMTMEESGVTIEFTKQ